MRTNSIEEIDGSKQKSQEMIYNAENKIRDLTKELAEQSKEIVLLQEQLKRSEVNRKKFLESIKDMEIEISSLNQKQTRLEKKYQDLKTENDKNLIQLRNEKCKTANYEKKINELDNITNERNSLLIQIEETIENKTDSLVSLNSLKSIYENSRVN